MKSGYYEGKGAFIKEGKGVRVKIKGGVIRDEKGT